MLQLLKIQSIKNYYYFYLIQIDEDIDIEMHDHHNNNHMENHNMALKENEIQLRFCKFKINAYHHSRFGIIDLI